MTFMPSEPRVPRSQTHLSRVLAAAALGTLLVAALGIWVLATSATTPGSGAHAAGHAPLRDYMGPTQLSGGRPVSLPAYVTTPTLREAYQFALDRPDVLMYMPCYCGCGLEAHHRSNRDCFIKGVDGQGNLVFDDHASGCQTCVDIALDAKQLVAQGKTLPEIRKAIDQNHGQKGPGTDTPLPPAQG